MITKDKLILFVKRWRDLEKLRKEYEYGLAVLMKDIRACFQSGDKGDEKFTAWVTEELNQTAGQAGELLKYAKAVAVVPDSVAWKTHGPRQVMRLAELPPQKRVAALNEVKVTGYALSTVLNRMTRPPQVAVVPHTRSLPNTVPTPTVHEVALLAKFINDNLKNIPDGVLRVIHKYLPADAPVTKPASKPHASA